MNCSFHGKQKMTRTTFESLILGEWKQKGRRRVNGKFVSWSHDQWKFISDGKSTIRARGWWELARALRLA